MVVTVDINAIPKAKEVTKLETKETEKELSPADKIMAARVKGEETRAMIEGLGGTGKGGDDEALKYAKEAMSMQSSTIKSLDESRKLTQEALTKSETAKNDALTMLYTNQLTTIKEAEQRVKEASGAGQPKSEIQVYKEVQAQIGELVRENLPRSESRVQVGLSEEGTLRLEQMKIDHAVNMKKLDLEIEKSDKEFQIRLEELKEENRRHWQEFSDKRDMQSRGLSGFEDMAAAISAGITKERAAASGAPPVAAAAAAKVAEPEPEPGLDVEITSFPCQRCQTEVPVIPGEAAAKCPKCNLTYKVRPT